MIITIFYLNLKYRKIIQNMPKVVWINYLKCLAKKNDLYIKYFCFRNWWIYSINIYWYGWFCYCTSNFGNIWDIIILLYKKKLEDYLKEKN